MKPTAVFRNISGFQYFQVFRFAAFFVTGIILVKSGFSVQEVSLFESFLFLSAAVSFFWINGLMQSLLIQYSGAGEKKALFFNAFILIVITSFLFAGLIKLLDEFFLSQFLQQKEFGLLNILLIYIILNNPGFIIEHYYLLKKQQSALVIYGLSFFLLQTGTVGLAIYIFHSVWHVVLALVVVSLMKLLWTLRLLYNENTWKINLDNFKLIILPALPLILGSLITGSAEFIDGFLVTSFFGSDQFAIFRYGAREFPLTILLANALSASFVPLISQKGTSKEIIQFIKNKSGALMHLLFPVVAVLLLFSHSIFPLIFNESYRESAVIFNIYLLLIIPRLIFPQSILMGSKKLWLLMWISGGELILNITFSLIFIPIWGIAGIALGTLAAFFSDKLFQVIYLSKYIKVPPETYIPLKNLIIYSFILLVCFIISVNNDVIGKIFE